MPTDGSKRWDTVNWSSSTQVRSFAGEGFDELAVVATGTNIMAIAATRTLFLNRDDFITASALKFVSFSLHISLPD